MTKVSKFKYATPTRQRLRKFVQDKIANAFIVGYFVGAGLIMLLFLLHEIKF